MPSVPDGQASEHAILPLSGETGYENPQNVETEAGSQQSETAQSPHGETGETPSGPMKVTAKLTLPKGCSAELRMFGASGSPPSCFE